MSDSSYLPTLFIGLATVVLTSPILLKIANNLIANYERKRFYSDFIAVFMSNNQVYFGKMTKLTRTDLKLEQIYYLSANAYDNSIDGEITAELVKLGKELHGPEDHMLINRQHILFIESLTEAGKVVAAINQHGVKK
jgi:hypothetical protein